MAASPETAILPVSSDTHPSPHPPSSPGPRPSQESPSLTSAASLVTANPDHATSGPPTPAEQSTVEHSESDQPPPPPIDEAEPPPPPLLEAAPAASRAHESTSPEKPASLSPHPADVAVQVSPKLPSSSPSRSPSPSPKIVEASPEEAPQLPSPPCTPAATAARASTDPLTTEAMEMASREAARPSPATESVDANSHTAPSPPPPMESVPEGLLPQQQPGPQSLAMAPPLCENSGSAQPPPLCNLSEGTDASPDEGVAGTSAKASDSSPVPESTDEDTDPTPALLPALEIGAEEMLPQQQPRPPCPEIAPLQGGNDASAVASEEAAPPAFEAMDVKAAAALEIGPERSSQEPVGTPMSSRMEDEPSSPDMAPPGFEDFKSQWLPLPPPNPPAESTDAVVLVAAAIAMATAPDAATESLSSLEAMDVKDVSLPGLLSPLKSWAEGWPQQPLLGSCSPTTEAAPCSPDMPPPGFENCKSSWLPLPTLQPVVQTTYTLPDMASAKAVPMAFVEKTCSVPVLEAIDVEKDTEWLLPPLESGTGSSLQGQLTRSCSPMMQVAPCSPDIAPPGFENLKLTQLQPPYPPVVQTAHTLQDSAADEAMYVTSEEAPLPSRASEAMDLDMDATAALAPPSESKPERSLQPEPPLLASHVAQYTACSQEMVPLGSGNLECSQMLQTAVVLPLHQTPDALADAETKKTVTMEEVCYPLPVAGATKEANGSILSPALENGCEGQLADLKPQASSPAVHAVATSPDIAPTSFENLESSQLSSSLAETKTIDPSSNEPATMPVIAKSETSSQPLSPSQATNTYIANATLQQSPLKSEEKSCPQSEQHPSSPSVKDSTCSPEVAPLGYENLDSEQLPPPPPLTLKLEIGQMVCGCCRQLLAYPRGAAHVQCRVCWTINLVLEEHQVGKVYCGQCETLLMYPFGAPAVKCSNCLFVTEIGERNVRPRVSMEQSVSPHAHELLTVASDTDCHGRLTSLPSPRMDEMVKPNSRIGAMPLLRVDELLELDCICNGLFSVVMTRWSQMSEFHMFLALCSASTGHYVCCGFEERTRMHGARFQSFDSG
ncbi:hypothetical protein U9M48_018461, partial [Paspalum notatum var. saurae]